MSKNIFSLIKSDLQAAKSRDPAARSLIEIIFTYSGFHAIFLYRISHILWKIHLKFLARFLSNIARIITSIEIHPASKIDEGFFVDHGAGLVIGETSELGKNVTMYQQVTLGGISPSLNSEKQKNLKRHPTIGDNVIIGSGAQILGPIKIGNNSRIGANAVVLNDVPVNQTYIGIPARKVRSKSEISAFMPYGIIDGKIDDPNKSRIVGILNEFNEISSRIKLLEEELDNFNTKDRFIEDSVVECEKKKKNNDLGNENETNIKR